MFKIYLEAKNTHQLHLEQLVWSGIDALREAINIFRNFRDELLKNNISNDKYKVTVKLDGAPAIFVGRLNNKFFVSSKALFAKNPRVAYSIKDIDDDKFFSDGLKKKLKELFPYLQELQFNGVYQGDVLFTESNKEIKTIDDIEYITFRANTITYAVEKNSDIGDKIDKAKLGIAFHTKYSGNDISNLKTDLFDNKIKSTENIYLISAEVPSGNNLLLTENEVLKINSNLIFIGKQFHYVKRQLFDGLKQNQLDMYLETFINAHIKTGNMVQNLDKFELWMRQKIETQPNSIAKKMKIGLEFFLINKAKIEILLSIYLKLQEIKMIFLDKFSNIDIGLRHFIITDTSIEPTNPEGFCIVNMKDQNIYKFVDRLNFSKNNFNLIKNWGNKDENI